MRMKILILGAGNLLRSDDGFGVHLIHFLNENYAFPPEVERLDAGTLGILVAHELEQADRVYFVDALDAPGEPGTIRCYRKEEFLGDRFPVKLSPHQIGVQEMLWLSELRGRCPAEVFLWGIIPASLAPGCTLTPCVQNQLATVAQRLVDDMNRTGIAVVPRQARL
jgi:hydrogenase maturation protease